MASRGRRSEAPREERISKTMSYILRHGAEKEGVPINKGLGLILKFLSRIKIVRKILDFLLFKTSDGFIKVSDLLKHPQLSGSNEAEIIRIVDACPKKRFALKRIGEDGSAVEELYVRANQGHSMQDVEVEMTEITDNDPIDTIIHGTFYRAWDTIKAQVSLPK